MVPEQQLVERFERDLDALTAADARVGIAVSGGSDSLALLLLAAAARPYKIEAASVDHALREGSREESEMVAKVCKSLGVPHAILTAQWRKKPTSAIQERARNERYRLLAGWAQQRELGAIATAHHADDQAETLLMRLARGAGARGLAGMRPMANVPDGDLPLIRPLLAWRRAELEQICIEAGLQPAADPSNDDEQFERVRIRRALADSKCLDPQALATSAANLAEADAALNWAVRKEWQKAVVNGAEQIVYCPADAPGEIRRRIVAQIVARLTTEGEGADLRGRELDRLLAMLGKGGQSTIRGVLCSGGAEWRFAKAPLRRT